MFDVFVAALFCDLCDALLCVCEQIFCLAETKVDHVVHTGYTKLLFVEQLQMPGADMQLLCHFADGPRKLRGVGYLAAQHQEVMVARGHGVVQCIIAQFQEQDAQQLGNDCVVIAV